MITSLVLRSDHLVRLHVCMHACTRAVSTRTYFPVSLITSLVWRSDHLVSSGGNDVAFLCDPNCASGGMYGPFFFHSSSPTVSWYSLKLFPKSFCRMKRMCVRASLHGPSHVSCVRDTEGALNSEPGYIDVLSHRKAEEAFRSSG